MRKHSASAKPFPATWQISTEVDTPVGPLVEGDVFLVTGEPGRFTFKHHVTLEGRNDGGWVTGFGGMSRQGEWRSFDLDRVRQIRKGS